MSNSKNLDPGPSRTRTQRTSVSCKCTTATVGAILALVAYAVFVKIAWEFYWNMREPHYWMYSDKTAEEVQDWSAVVRPLVDRNQKFDIAATVWARKPHQYRESYGLTKDQPLDEPIFSGVVFRGVTFMDEHVHAKVNLSIPLKTFKEKHLENWDLRASFKLLPQSSSLLRYMKTFTTWHPPAYFLTFPPISQGNDPRHSVADSYGVTVPLIDFHPVKSSCGKSFGIQTRGDAESEDSEREAIFVSTKGKSLLDYHPYVVTRTDLRVVRMERLYDRYAYERHQNNLQLITMDLNGCPAGSGGDGRWCYRSFRSRANCETEIELEIPDENTGLNTTQFAYAPYLHVNRQSRGPLDLIAMPLNREGCPDTPAVEDHLNVTWNIAYSGSTAEKLEFSEFIAFSRFNLTDTEFNKAQAQQSVENIARFHGHKFSSQSHVGRKMMADLIRSILIFIRFPLQIQYWYTRNTTVGISTVRSYLLAVALTLYFIHDIWESGAFEPDISSMRTIYRISGAFSCGLLISIGILTTTLRLEFVKQRPFVRVLPASHLERASRRLESRGGMRWMFTVLAGSFALYLIAPFRDFHLITPLGPRPDPSPGWITPRDMEVLIMYPLTFSGLIFQMVMNYKAKTFAGDYKVAAWAEFVEVLLRLAPHTLSWISKSVGGAPDVLRDGFTLEDLVYMCAVGAFAIQANIYPGVRQDIEDEGSE